MPRVCKVFKKRKNVGKPKIISITPESIELLSTPSTSRPTSSTSRDDKSSRSSVKLGDTLEEYNNYSDSFVYDIVNFNLVNELIGAVGVCSNCHGQLNLYIDRKKGLACDIILECDNCKKSSTTKNTDIGSYNDRNIDDINVRFVYAMRSIGRGESAAVTFCNVMNLPKPARFNFYNNILGSVVKDVCSETMKEAAEEAVVHNDGDNNIAAVFDGTWQKRGYASMNGVVSAISVGTGKVMDVSILSKYCRCKDKLKNIHDDDKCFANYSGTSGGMEVEGVRQMFERSVNLNNVCYKYYLGDGDSKAYTTVANSNPYGPDIQIEKLECINHVQKRMGSRLRTLKSKLGKEKLSDGKTIGGHRRLTDSRINEIQTYYGLSIRRNLTSVQDMKTAIWASYFHLSSSNENPTHELCPSEAGTWCKYRKSIIEGKPYDHDKHTHLPSDIMKAVKPIFQDLSNPILLAKCSHGGTQNVSESLNSVIWQRIPKNIFVSLQTLKLGVYDAVSAYNIGNLSKCRVFKKLGLKPGYYCIHGLREQDMARIKFADKKIEEIQQKCRKNISNARKLLEDEYAATEDADNPSYAAGMH